MNIFLYFGDWFKCIWKSENCLVIIEILLFLNGICVGNFFLFVYFLVSVIWGWYGFFFIWKLVWRIVCFVCFCNSLSVLFFFGFRCKICGFLWLLNIFILLNLIGNGLVFEVIVVSEFLSCWICVLFVVLRKINVIW